MSVEIKMPRLSDTMDEGKIVEWKVKAGDQVAEGDLLCVIETDKADVEFESFYAGTISEIRIQEGEVASLGEVIALLVEEGEEATLPEPRLAGTRRPSGASAAPPREKAVAAPQEATERAPAKDAPAKAVSRRRGDRLSVSPVARRLAEEQGISLDEIVGSGPEGRIVKADVEAAIGTAGRPAAGKRAPGAGDTFVDLGRDKLGDLSALSPMRRTIARRMEESWRTAPHFTLTMRVDMGNSEQFRAELKEAHPEAKITMNDLIVAASGRALREFPGVNASYEEGQVRMLRDVNVGIAVAVDDGLVTPVIRNADKKRLVEIASEGRDLAARGRARKLKPEEYRGGSFTVSNLGMLGVEEFAAIMNPPEGAILAVGAITEVPVVRNGQIKTARLMKMTLSCDHRIIDGATGARFLGKIKELLENPALLTL